jgi:hypothetical protein
MDSNLARGRPVSVPLDHLTSTFQNIHVSERDYGINPRFSAFIGFVVHGYPHNDFRIFCARVRPFALNNFRLFDLSKQALHEYPSWQAATPLRRNGQPAAAMRRAQSRSGIPPRTKSF